MNNQKIKGKQIKKVDLYPNDELFMRKSFDELEEAGLEVAKYHSYRQKTHEIKHLKSIATNVRILTTITIICLILTTLVAFLYSIKF